MGVVRYHSDCETSLIAGEYDYTDYGLSHHFLLFLVFPIHRKLLSWKERMYYIIHVYMYNIHVYM